MPKFKDHLISGFCSSSQCKYMENIKHSHCVYPGCDHVILREYDDDYIEDHVHCNLCDRTTFHLHCQVEGCIRSNVHVHCQICENDPKFIDYHLEWEHEHCQVCGEPHDGNHQRCDKCGICCNDDHNHCPKCGIVRNGANYVTRDGITIIHVYCPTCDDCVDDHFVCQKCYLCLLGVKNHRYCDQCNQCFDRVHFHCDHTHSDGDKCTRLDIHRHCYLKYCKLKYRHMHCQECGWINQPGPFQYHQHCLLEDGCQRTDDHDHGLFSKLYQNLSDLIFGQSK